MLVDSSNSTAGSAVIGAIRQAAQATGTSFQYLLATAQVESGLNPQAGASTSSARGLFQFIEQTWLATMKQSGTQLGYGQYANAITQNASGKYEVQDPAMRSAILKLRNDPAAAKRYAIPAINRALDGITVPTVIHLCFGYAAVVPGDTKPKGYAFLAELAQTTAQQISIESAQPKIDFGVLKDLAPKKIVLGVIDLGDAAVETPETVAARIRRGLEHVAPENLVPAPDCGMKYLKREVAFGKLEALARGAELLILEATYADDLQAAAAQGHITAGQAGELASDSHVKRLMLTHLLPGEQQSLQPLAERSFAGPVDLAREGLTYELDGSGVPRTVQSDFAQ